MQTGGGLVLKSKLDRVEAEKDDRARKYIRKYIGAEELIHGKDRWCLWLANSTPEDRTHSKFLKERLETVKKARENGQWKDNPVWLPVGGHQPNSSYLAVPKVFSERRQYATAGIEPEDVIASDELYLFLDPTGFAFSVIESSMFMAWQSLVGGRLKEDYRFSNTLVWNTFPLPSLAEEQKDRIIEAGAKVLEARAKNYLDASLADLYDPDNMPSDLKKAHEALDRAMDSVFSNKPLRSEEERQKTLLEMYKKMTNEK